MGIGAGLALLLTSGSEPSEPETESSSLTLVPHATESSTGAAITGTF